jgi:hypothetical protein
MATNRQEWEFEHSISDILAAATRRTQYHTERLGFWKNSLDAIVQNLPNTVNVRKLEEFMAASSFSNKVSYGLPSLQLDPEVQKDFTLAVQKIAEHRNKMEQYGTWVAVLANESSARSLKLTMEDIQFFSMHDQNEERWAKQDEQADE